MKYRIEKVIDGTQMYWQLVRNSDEAILAAYTDLSSIFQLVAEHEVQSGYKTIISK